MIVILKPEGATNVIEYEVNGGKNIDFDDGELIINLKKKERDDPVHLDICKDYTGGLIMGTGSDAREYVAQIDIPARRYVDVEDEGSESGYTREAVPFDIDLCTLTLWELEE